MKLTTKSEYSLLALIYIARYGKDEYVKVEKICDKYDITKKYLEHLLTALKQSRLIKTKRGAQGGYMLARPANKITVAEVIRLMDGALAPTESVSEFYFETTPISKEKKALKEFKGIRDYISRRLERLTIADLV
ncbi:MAG: Rrf2 family transcriptional regulator [Candidatus Kerfeldbacteria bacterium]